MSIEFLIAGQGLAGSLLAHFLLDAGKSILIVDPGKASPTSCAALGLLNPITGLRLTLAWRAGCLFSAAAEIYLDLEQRTGVPFFRKIDTLRLFIDEQQSRRWLQKRELPEMAPYFGEKITGDLFDGRIRNPAGGVRVSGSACVSTRAFIEASRRFFQQHGVFQQAAVSPAELELRDKNVRWRDVIARRVIFCEGAALRENPYFGWLPFAPNKGESLRVRIPRLALRQILIRDFFLIPEGDKDNFLVGSTHDWKAFDDKPTDAGREELLRKVSTCVDLPIEVLEHRAGVRPTSIDRKPILGLHPKWPQIGIFNGLGSKGFSQAPYFARQFAAFLCGYGTIDREVDVNRFKAYA